MKTPTQTPTETLAQSKPNKGILCICVIWLHGVRHANHFFHLPAFGTQGFYRETESFNGFRNRQSLVFYNWTQRKRWRAQLPIRGAMHTVDDMFLRSERIKNDPRLNIPAFNHDSIFDLYKAIGYDHERRRFLKFAELDDIEKDIDDHDRVPTDG